MRPTGTSNISLAANGPTVVIEIGPEAKKYYVHRALLVHHSEYFKKALQGSWTEAQTGLFKFPDIEPLVFNLFVHWLSSDKVPGFNEYDEWARGTQETSDDQASSAEDSNTEDEDDEYDAWRVLGLKAYAFADRFRVADFQAILNTAIVTHKFDAAVLFDDTLPETEYAFAHIPAERPILQFLVDDFCSRWKEAFDLSSEIVQLKSPGRLHDEGHEEAV